MRKHTLLKDRNNSVKIMQELLHIFVDLESEMFYYTLLVFMALNALTSSVREFRGCFSQSVSEDETFTRVKSSVPNPLNASETEKLNQC